MEKNSIYKTIPGLDCWDAERNALKWPGGNPGIFHPPCRLFSMFRLFSNACESEKALAYWSVIQVRKNKGILEHPAYSKLWEDAFLPYPEEKDAWGFTIELDQFLFYHPARKRTWLYICGADRKELPHFPLRLGDAEFTCSHSRSGKKEIPRSKRSSTPIQFAKWLIQIAENCA